MYRLLSFVALAGLAVALISFSLVNRTPVVVSAPFLQSALQVPLFLVFFFGMFAGAILCGATLLVRRLRSFQLKKRSEGR